jgi:hypothetical protein
VPSFALIVLIGPAPLLLFVVLRETDVLR